MDHHTASATTLVSSALSAPQRVLDLLTHLHKLSWDQEQSLKDDGGKYNFLKSGLSDAEKEAHFNATMQDKFIALDADKAALVYGLIRATGALNVVELGTSFGVSTIYLALAVGQNAKAAGKGAGDARVIATEFEAEKAARARRHWKECGDSVEPWIDLREGDLVKTLKSNVPTVDFVLLDIWTPMIIPALDILEPHFRPGTVLVCDNTISSAEGYKDFFARVKAPNSKYRTMTLPYAGGFEFVTYWPTD